MSDFTELYGSDSNPIQVDTVEEFYLIKVLHSSETELCKPPSDIALARNDLVILQTRYGHEIGRVLGPVQEENSRSWDMIRTIVRIATEHDRHLFQENLKREQEALEVCREKVSQHDLAMTLVSAHILIDEPKILIFFTSDERVDFRELVKDLVAIFRIRVELRQIGVRDESRVLGGIGVCGRVLCCNGVTDKLRPVTIKMAKVQNLSLNSVKISGPCGRLLCCLAYENEFYRDERKALPSEGYRFPHDGTVFRVSELNVVSHQVKIQGDDGRVLVLPSCRFIYDTATQRWRVSESENCPAAEKID